MPIVEVKPGDKIRLTDIDPACRATVSLPQSEFDHTFNLLSG
jgi:hypothetical protein